MNNKNKILLVLFFVFCANINCTNAYAADYTGGLPALTDALNQAGTTDLNRNFFQTEDIKLGSDNMPGTSVRYGVLTINGNGHDIDGNSKNGFYSTEHWQTLNISNVGSLDRNGNIRTSAHDFYKSSDGGSVIYNDTGVVNINNSVFANNNNNDSGGGDFSGIGGVLLSWNDWMENHISNSIFDHNSAMWGGAIANYNAAGVSTIDHSIFSNNSAYNHGGAIYNFGYNKTYNQGHVDLTTTYSVFYHNSAYAGGAIYNRSDDGLHSLTVDYCDFIDNFSSDSGNGGAIFNTSGGSDISNSSFIANKAELGFGGAIFVSAGDVAIKNTTFDSNYAIDAGAIYNGGNLAISNSEFKNNYSTTYDGGAIDAEEGANTSITNSYFTNNHSTGNGGAIYDYKGILTIDKSLFDRNYTQGGNGGALCNDIGSTTTITNSTFINNHTTGNGGAIYNAGTLNLIANNGITSFTNNKANGVSNAIYNLATVNLNAGNGGLILFNDKINSSDINNQININKPGLSAPTDGAVLFNDTISNSTINFYNGTMALGRENLLNGNNLALYGGTINMVNNSIGTASLNNLVLNGTTNLAIDADLNRNVADKLTATSVSGSGHVNIANINLLGASTNKNANILFANAAVKDYVRLGVTTATTPILNYNVSYDGSSGNLNFVASNFNPTVLATPVAATAGAYTNQTMAYSEVLGRVDTVMFIPRADRLLMQYQNKTASADGQFVFSPTLLPEADAGTWVKQYTSFENVPLNNGPNVSSVGYGMLVGEDTKLKHFRNGSDGYLTAYIGYNGSHQNYDNVGVYQNGGLLGLTGTIYKGDFFSALTANVGASMGESSNQSGTDNFSTLMAGLALKSGYNFEFLKGKCILQPSMLVAYTFANTFNYTTASGVDITSDPLNAIQLSPGIKLIGNLKNGWQPYLGVSMVWNIMDAQKFYANNVQLPMMSISPYVEYGVGLQRKWGDRFTGFGQAMARGGGRNGVALLFGFRWAVGK